MVYSREHPTHALPTAQLPSYAAAESLIHEVPLRQYIVLPALLLLTVLFTGCGNGNDGRPLTPYKKTGASTSAASTNVASALQIDYCQNFVPFDGSQVSGIQFNGASVCKIKSQPTTVRIRVGANFPINGRFCVVPMNELAFRESCFAINGQADVILDAAVQTYGYGSLALILESDLPAYRAYLNFTSQITPPRGVAFLTQ